MSNKMLVTYSLGEALEMGLDEAGRGCFWGPLFAGAVIWPPEEEWTEEHREIVPQINDSKKMTEKKRDYVAGAIRELALDWGVGAAYTDEINANGITWANRTAFTRAVLACSMEPDLLLIDGVLGLSDEGVLQGTKYTCIPGGDGLYVPIAAASILAKVGRDTWVKGWCEEHPDLASRYDLLSNKGYGTVKHREGLKTYGVDSGHRSLYVRNWI
jgi:ribonuclease HII